MSGGLVVRQRHYIHSPWCCRESEVALRAVLAAVISSTEGDSCPVPGPSPTPSPSPSPGPGASPCLYCCANASPASTRSNAPSCPPSLDPLDKFPPPGRWFKSRGLSSRSKSSLSSSSSSSLSWEVVRRCKSPCAMMQLRNSPCRSSCRAVGNAC